MAQLHQIIGTAQSRRSAADNGNFLSGWRLYRRQLNIAGFTLVIGREPFKVANGYLFIFFGKNSCCLTLIFLRADPAANRRQHIILLDLFCGAEKIAFSDKLDKLVNLDVDRAPLDACRILALKTAKRLLLCKFRCIAKIDLKEIVAPHLRIL
jgi:hypothetical protein